MASGTQAVIGDHVAPDGRPFEASPRAVLKSLIERYRALDLEPVLGYEYEVWIFEENKDCERGDLTRFQPFGATENAYSLTRSAEIDRFAQQFIDRMNEIGIEIEAFHAELGPGFFEFTLTPQPALRAADNAARARQYLRDLCAEHGLRASFMAKPFADKSAPAGMSTRASPAAARTSSRPNPASSPRRAVTISPAWSARCPTWR